ncbi:UNVERIFIED_CONTAM: hypothetical protein Cloal_3343 [Acetivibrio alkalicellulosi]
MESSFWEKYISLINKRLFVTTLTLLIIGIIFLILFGNNFYNMIMGPFSVSPQEINTSAESLDFSKSYITVESDNTIHSGLVKYIGIKKRGSDKMYSTQPYTKYLLMYIDGKYLIVNVSNNFEGTSFTGRLIHLDDDLKSNISSSIINIDNAFTSIDILPLMLDTNVDYFYYWILFIITLLFWVLGLWGMCKYFLRIKNPYNHPLYKDLENYGDPKKLASEIDREILEDNKTYKNIILTSTWCIYAGSLSVKIFKLDDIIYIYRTSLDKTYIIHIFFKTGKDVDAIFTVDEFSLSENLLNDISTRMPWIINEFSPEHQKMYKNRIYEMIDLVEKRKRDSSIANS